MNEPILSKASFVHSFTCKIDERYKIFHKLGDGSYGRVFLAQHNETNQVRAIKDIPKRRLKSRERLDNEIKVLSYADHPNICRIFEFIEDESDIYLVLEHCKGGELFDFILKKGRLSELEAAILFRQLLLAINYLHSNGVCHRDIKPENLMFSEADFNSSLKLIDFGLAKFVDNPSGLMFTRAGTPFYISPEILKGSYSMSTDNWSAGVILYVMLCGYPPFYSKSDNEIFRLVLNGNYSFRGKEWTDVSPLAKDLIRHLLVVDPSLRLTAEQALKHEWLSGLTLTDTPLEININSLRSFNISRKFRKAILLCVASQCNECDISNLRTHFMRIDRNGKGSITYDELHQVLQQYSAALGDEIGSIIASMDVNRNGIIDYTEFLAASLDKSIYMQQERLITAFKVFDKNNNGLISIDDLKELLGKEDLQDNEYWEEIIRDADANGDGVVDFNDFIAAIDLRLSSQYSYIL
ncbi:unnamed protein product [Blepharisma stoltei]|uniref:non-specific serine/threonine protein kinase n=1 Tax=Blepharisma stoltei TaxID=1481888 RepID=A0AAU9JRC0_9CILI|nr:unnamed protein product [Blepharisma stoltei]